MQINDIVMVYDNEKGHERKLLLTRIDYVNDFLSVIYTDDQPGLARSLWELEETRKSRKSVQEEYIWGNHSIQARFCTDRDQLRSFLSETDESTGEWIPLDVAESSQECIRAMYSHGMNEDGSRADIRYRYEPTAMSFESGSIIRNLNGREYRIMENYSPQEPIPQDSISLEAVTQSSTSRESSPPDLPPQNLLLQDTQNGSFMVAVGAKAYLRYPDMEGYSVEDAVFGIEWAHGIYLNTARPSEVDFASVREKYGQEELYREAEASYGYAKDGKEHAYEVEVAEMFQTAVTINAESLADATILPKWQPPVQQTDLYLHNREYAAKLGETGWYLDSYRKNVRCKETLDDALHDGFVDGKLQYDIAGPLIEMFGEDRVRFILAESIGLLQYTSRVSRINRDWAKKEYRNLSNRFGDSYIGRDPLSDFIIRPTDMPNDIEAISAFVDQFRGITEKPELSDDVNQEAGVLSEDISKASQKFSQQVRQPKPRSPKI